MKKCIISHNIYNTIFIRKRACFLKYEHFVSKHNRNYLGCLELISKFNPFISTHILNDGNKGHGNVSYLSSTSDEFISLISKTVIDNIVIEIKNQNTFQLLLTRLLILSLKDLLDSLNQ